MVLRNMIEQPTLRDSKYIFNVCKEFTTLNRQEDVNLKEIINFKKGNFVDSNQINKSPKQTVNLFYKGNDCTKDFSKYLSSLICQDF